MGRKTSVYLSDEQIERWHQSGLSLSELVSRGLDVADGLALEVGRAVLGVLRADVARTAVMVHTVPDTVPESPPDTVRDTAPERADTAAHTVSAAPVKVTTAARQARTAAPAPRVSEPKCHHPKARVLKGQCRVCGEYVGKSS